MMIDLAVKAGFERAAAVKTADIPIEFAFRGFCEQNICGQYGKNYSCPPDCGTPEQMRDKILSKKRALVVQSVNKIVDYSEKEIRSAKSRHCNFAVRLENLLKSSGVEGFTVGACGCTICNPCLKELSLPCKCPERAFSCMSAYCINVKKLCDTCGFEYNLSPHLALFGMYVFD